MHLAPCGQHPHRGAPRARAGAADRLRRQAGGAKTRRRADPGPARSPTRAAHRAVAPGRRRRARARKLEKLAVALGVADSVSFYGRVPQDVRDRLVGSAWITATASMGEGWGLSVMEAAAAGVPAVAYSVPGLRDTVRHGVTGWLLEPGDDLAGTLIEALRACADPVAAAARAERCREWAGRFSWAATAAHLLAALTAEDRRLHSLGPDRRTGTDASTLVAVPTAALTGADLTALRATDLLDTSQPGRTVALLVGADEHDAEAALARIGVDTAVQGISIRLARHSDTLGWREHPPVPAAPPAPAGPAAPTASADGAPTARHPRAGLTRAALLGGLFTLALLARLAFIDRSYDIFVDEITYSVVGHDLASGGGLTLYHHPFDLHPPAFFSMLAAVIRTVGLSGDRLHVLLALRPVDAVAGAVVVVAVTALLDRAVRRPVAVTAGLLLALDPFLNLFDSRLLLEARPPPPPRWACCCWPAPRPGPARAATGIGAGLLFALSITTKELYVFVSLLPALVLAFAARGPVRRTRLTAAAVATAGYAVYVIAIAATGGWSAWWTQKTQGVDRAVGTVQITGFNSPTAPVSLVSSLEADLANYTVAYTVLVLGGCATAWLLLQRARRPWVFAGHPARSAVTAWAAGGFLFIGYAIAFGTLEEQMFYPVMVTGTAALAVAVDRLLPRPLLSRPPLTGTPPGEPLPARPPAAGRPRVPRVPRRVGAALALTLAALAADATVWTQVHTRHDDTYRRMLAWTSAHIHKDSTLDATDGSAQFLLTGYRIGDWTTRAELDQHQVQYLLLSTRLDAEGYVRLDPSLTAQLGRGIRLLHCEAGQTSGDLCLYDTRALVAADTRHSPGSAAVGGPRPGSQSGSRTAGAAVRAGAGGGSSR
ncbi:glycosyltransferase [Streptacidiphilus sp. 4-A2]|nr:glycosyltransferase [Streptacidiphilus sp. 4-A2]